MLSRTEIWNLLGESIDSPEVTLYDIDMPAGTNGILRVYLARRDNHAAGISIDDCASVSRRISANPQFEVLLHQCGLEVSSPGINRRLRRDEHFVGAVGERVTVAARSQDGTNSTVTGLLKSCVDGTLIIEPEVDESEAGETEAVIEITLGSVQKARVDFKF
jgi:ribosome maturation factor RimP